MATRVIVETDDDCKRRRTVADQILRNQEIIIGLLRKRAVTLSIEEDQSMAITIGADDAPKGLKVVPKDHHGNTAPVDGIPVWSSSDESLLTVEASADGLKATIVAVGPVGTVQVVVGADADLGAGIVPITGTLDVTIVPGMAADLGIEIDA